MTKPKPYTEDECRDKFLDAVWRNILYWEHEARVPDVRTKLEGLAHSLLVMLDGNAGAMPAFIVAPFPHPDDWAYAEEQGEAHYWPPARLDFGCDLAGRLHERFYRRQPNKETEDDDLQQLANELLDFDDDDRPGSPINNWED